MGALRDDNYFVVHGWMINQLGLKGNDLRVYAIIYGFTQANGQWFTGSLQYLADWVSGTKNGVSKNLKFLFDKGLIEKKVQTEGGIRCCSYRAIPLKGIQLSCTPRTTELDGGIQLSCTPRTTELDEGIQLSCTNNKSNKESNKESNKKEGANAPALSESFRFIPPTVEEVRAYCQERKNRVDAAAFVDFYDSKGWMIGKNKMKSWKSAVRTWESRERNAAPTRSTVKTEEQHAAGGHASGFGW